MFEKSHNRLHAHDHIVDHLFCRKLMHIMRNSILYVHWICRWPVIHGEYWLRCLISVVCGRLCCLVYYEDDEFYILGRTDLFTGWLLNKYTHLEYFRPNLSGTTIPWTVVSSLAVDDHSDDKQVKLSACSVVGICVLKGCKHIDFLWNGRKQERF
jgi:hypothetical protein